MNSFNLAYTLEIGDREIAAAYGGGGKTTLLNRLARELAGTGRKVLLTTTTKILRPDNIPVVVTSSFKEAMVQIRKLFDQHSIVVLGSSLLANNKIKGIETKWLGEFYAFVPYILVEADGAARKPIKGFASFEPVFPPNATLLLPLLGLDALGVKLDTQNVHRPELLGEIAEIMPGERIEINHINRYLQYAIKLGTEAVPGARIITVINKMDLLAEPASIQEIKGYLSGHPAVSRLLFTSLQDNFPVKFVFDPAKAIPFISCITLAAGCSERMGKDKLALKIKGKTILEHSVGNALQSKAGEVIVVTRPESLWVKELFQGQRVKVVVNPFYRQGISSSIKEGLAALHPLSQGAIFALGDQPFIESDVYNNLIEAYDRKLRMVTCPLYEGKRGNPVLFDRRTWSALLELKGDRGGQQLFAHLPDNEIYNVETSCSGVLEDIDTPDDYQELL